jgi:hypothetical protein
MPRDHDALIESLPSHYSSDKGYVVVPKVQLFHGMRHHRDTQAREADGLVLNIFDPEDVVYVEAKTGKGDMRKELNDPSKAGAFQPWCSERYVVCYSWRDILIRKDDLPEEWGLIVVDKGQAHIERKSPETKAEPFDPRLWLSLVKAASNQRARDDASDGAPMRQVKSVGRAVVTLDVCQHELPASLHKKWPQCVPCFACKTPSEDAITRMLDSLDRAGQMGILRRLQQRLGIDGEAA